MRHSSAILNHLPPRLSMDEYADFVAISLREADPVRAARQKKLEERIKASFRLVQSVSSGKKTHKTLG